MKITELEKGQALLVLRFSLSYRKNMIEEHQELIKRNGYVWYGKLGGVTSPKIISETFVAKRPALMLYSKGKAYLCDVKEISGNKPRTGYPEYYDTECICPGCYYKITSMDEIDEDILNHLYVRSSKRLLADTLSRQCTASCFFVSYEEIMPLRAGKKEETERIKKLSKHECIYRKDGICKRTGFINYGYTCDKPSNCIKQKR